MLNKKVLMSTIAGVATLGLSGFAFAGGDFAPAPACDHGKSSFYVGGSVGWGDNRWDYEDDYLTAVGPDTISTKHTGFAGGAYLGYALNRFLAFQGEYMYASRARVSDSSVVGRATNIKNHAFALVGKISVPLDSVGVENVDLFAKAGVSYLRSKFSPTVAGAEAGYAAGTVSNTNLTYGLGVAWDMANIIPNVVANFTFQRFHGKQTVLVAKSQPFMDTYTFGLTYHLDNLGGDLFNT